MDRICAILCLGALLCAACSPGPKDRGSDTKAPLENLCISYGEIRLNPDGTRTIGQLRCEGWCLPDTLPCEVVTNADTTRQWCGCNSSPEPEDCHLVRIKQPNGSWVFDCDGPCDDPSEMCTPDLRVDPTDTMKYVITCPCAKPQ